MATTKPTAALIDAYVESRAELAGLRDIKHAYGYGLLVAMLANALDGVETPRHMRQRLELALQDFPMGEPRVCAPQTPTVCSADAQARDVGLPSMECRRCMPGVNRTHGERPGMAAAFHQPTDEQP